MGSYGETYFSHCCLRDTWVGQGMAKCQVRTSELQQLCNYNNCENDVQKECRVGTNVLPFSVPFVGSNETKIQMQLPAQYNQFQVQLYSVVHRRMKI
jgi:hypothetical protein